MKRAMATAAIGSALLLTAACGSSTSSAPSSAASSGEAAPSPVASGTVPDPCTLLSADSISAIIGVDPGASQSTAEGPVANALCVYDVGPILSIGLAADWDAMMKETTGNTEGATTTDLSGLGKEALLTELNGVLNLSALGDTYYVGVTGDITADQAKAIVTAMLEAAE